MKKTYAYKALELEDYTKDEQSTTDKKIVKALITGDDSELIEVTEVGGDD